MEFRVGREGFLKFLLGLSEKTVNIYSSVLT
jgi:predicted transcriptional regulator